MRVLVVALLALGTLTTSFLLPPSSPCRRTTIGLNAEVETGTTKRRRAPPRLSGYILDPRDDRSAFFENDTEVYQLLEERAIARREQNWKEADRILDELRSRHNVNVYDGFAPQFARVISRQNSIPINVLKERYTKQYGPNCHPYTHVGPPTLDPITCPLTMNDIHNALSRRLWLKIEKRFAEADSHLYELRTYGIEVNDNLKQWRSDGKVLFDPEWSLPPVQPLPYKEMASPVIPERIRVRVKQLVNQRAIALARNDSNLASALQYELFMTYDVIINDCDLTWRVQTNGEDHKFIFTPSVHPPFRTSVTNHLPTMATRDPEHNWTLGGPYRYNDIVSSGRTLSRYEEVRVIELMMQRDELRSMRHYAEADCIVRELGSTYNVDIDDSCRQYSVGRSFAQYDELATTTGAARAPATADSIMGEDVLAAELPDWWEIYMESGLGNHLDPSKTTEVENLIKYLSSQQQRNPNIVERLMGRLEEEYGLYFDGSTWKLKGKIQPYRIDISKSQRSVPEHGIRRIQELVDMRNEQMFKIKNTGMAEILEAGLRSQYSVVINDETQTWYLEDSSKS